MSDPSRTVSYRHNDLVPTNYPAAPHWLRQLSHTKPVPIPWKRAARAAGGIGGSIAIGMAVGRLDLGVLASIGALCATLADTDGPYRHRAIRLCWVVTAGTAGFLLGAAFAHHPVPAAVLLVLISAISALISSGGDTAAMAGTHMLVFAVVGSGQSADPVLATGCFLAGATLETLLAVGAWPVRATAPERAGVAAVYDELVDMLSATGTAAGRLIRQRLTTALNEAYDRVLRARSRLAGRDLAERRLLILLSGTAPIVEASIAVLHSGRRPPDEVIQWLAAVGAAIRTDAPLPAPAATPDNAEPAVRALYQSSRGLGEHTKPAVIERIGGRDRVRTWLDSVLAGPVTWRFVLRLTVCVTLATLVGMALPLRHASWVVLTVAIVLKPDFGSVFGRAVLRVGGTAVGAALGAGILAVGARGWVLAVFIALIAAALPIGQARNYGMYTVFITPLVLVQLDLARAGHVGLITDRLVDTALGCAIVLIGGYPLWPSSRHADVRRRLAEAIDTIGGYLDARLSGEPIVHPNPRRVAYRQLADLRTVFQQAIVEPSAARRQVVAWWPLIIGLERLTDAITGMAVGIDQGAPPLPPADVRASRAGLAELAGAIRDQRTPHLPPLPTSARLATLVTELSSIARLSVGPADPESRDGTADSSSHSA